MKPINSNKSQTGFITHEEGNAVRLKAKRVLREIKLKEATEGVTEGVKFSGRVNGKFTQLSIRGDNPEDKLERLCLAKGWDFSAFTRS